MAGLVLPAAGGNLRHCVQGQDPSQPSSSHRHPGALAAWRVTQGIYRFDPTTFDALWKTPVTGDIPTEVLFHLPEWCVYIPTPDQTWQGAMLNGFFAHLECDMNKRRIELRLVLDVTGAAGDDLIVMPIHLGKGGVTGGVEAMLKEAARQFPVTVQTPEGVLEQLSGDISADQVGWHFPGFKLCLRSTVAHHLSTAQDRAMRCFRSHIGTLVILVLLMGVGFAALRESNEPWDTSIFSITLGVLLISILPAVHRSEKRRAFWLGFALFGSAYLGLSLVPTIESRLITSRGLAFLDSKIRRSISASEALYNLLVEVNSQTVALAVNTGNGNLTDVPVVAGSKPWFPNILTGPPLTGSSGTTENFMRIGHSLLALIAACLGGLLSRYFVAENRGPVSGSINS